MDVKEKNRLRMIERRTAAKAVGALIKSDTWFFENRDKHNERVRKWRENNKDKAVLLSRSTQAKRRSTPWGKINNRVWPIIHRALKQSSDSKKSKYCDALGYNWVDLKRHLESQFNENMNWDNWGSYWQIDHIKELKNYRYEDISDESFKECWGLENLRPLERHLNSQRTRKHLTEFKGL